MIVSLVASLVGCGAAPTPVAPVAPAPPPAPPRSGLAVWRDAPAQQDRAAWGHPVDLVRRSGVVAGDVVADLSADSGLLHDALTLAVGPEGHVLVGEDSVTDRATTVFLVDTLREHPDAAGLLADLGAKVAFGTRLVVVDFPSDDTPAAPPAFPTAPASVQTALADVGWWRSRAITGLLPYQYATVYRWEPHRAELRRPPEGWSDLRETLPGALFDVRYHTPNNFSEAPIPGYAAPGAWLRDAPAASLVAVQEDLNRLGFGLRIYDAYRPLRATLAMVSWAVRTDQEALLDGGYIARRSGHNRGNTVDLSLYTLATGVAPDMGTPWDTLSEASHTRNATGDALANRMTLREAMLAHGWEPYWREWWHFSYTMTPRPAAINVPYGCGEPDDWRPPSGWEAPGFTPPMTWPKADCP